MWTELLVAWAIIVGLSGAGQQAEKRRQQEIEQHNKEQQKIEQHKIEQQKIEQQIEEHNKKQWREQEQIALAESMRSEADLRKELLDMERWLVATQEPMNDFNDQALAAFANDPFSSETKAIMKKKADWKELEDCVKVSIPKLKKLLEKYEKTNNKPTDDIVTIDSVGKG